MFMSLRRLPMLFTLSASTMPRRHLAPTLPHYAAVEMSYVAVVARYVDMIIRYDTRRSQRRADRVDARAYAAIEAVPRWRLMATMRCHEKARARLRYRGDD